MVCWRWVVADLMHKSGGRRRMGGYIALGVIRARKAAALPAHRRIVSPVRRQLEVAHATRRASPPVRLGSTRGRSPGTACVVLCFPGSGFPGPYRTSGAQTDSAAGSRQEPQAIAVAHAVVLRVVHGVHAQSFSSINQPPNVGRCSGAWYGIAPGSSQRRPLNSTLGHASQACTRRSKGSRCRQPRNPLRRWSGTCALCWVVATGPRAKLKSPALPVGARCAGAWPNRSLNGPASAGGSGFISRGHQAPPCPVSFALDLKISLLPLDNLYTADIMCHIGMHFAAHHPRS